MATRPPFFEIHAIWSGAGIGTCSLAAPASSSGRPPSGPVLLFDLGCTPLCNAPLWARADCVLLSHGHADHVGALFGHARSASLQSRAATYVAPAALVSGLKRAMEAMAEVDAVGRGGVAAAIEIVGMVGGQEMRIPGRKGWEDAFFVRAFDVDHAGHPALGYVVVRRIRGRGLRKEYFGMERKRLKELKSSGVRISPDDEEVFELGYTGDTSSAGLMHDPASRVIDDHVAVDSRRSSVYRHQAFRARLLLCELTFIDDDFQAKRDTRDLARERGHVHILDLAAVFGSHGWNAAAAKGGSGGVWDGMQSVIFYHVSMRYHPVDFMLKTIARLLPPWLLSKAQVAVSAFLSREDEKTQLVKNICQKNGCVNLVDYMAQTKNDNIT